MMDDPNLIIKVEDDDYSNNFEDESIDEKHDENEKGGDNDPDERGLVLKEFCLQKIYCLTHCIAPLSSKKIHEIEKEDVINTFTLNQCNGFVNEKLKKLKHGGSIKKEEIEKPVPEVLVSRVQMYNLFINQRNLLNSKPKTMTWKKRSMSTFCSLKAEMLRCKIGDKLFQDLYCSAHYMENTSSILLIGELMRNINRRNHDDIINPTTQSCEINLKKNIQSLGEKCIDETKDLLDEFSLKFPNYKTSSSIVSNPDNPNRQRYDTEDLEKMVQDSQSLHKIISNETNWINSLVTASQE